MSMNQQPDSWSESLIRLRPLRLEDLEAVQIPIEEPTGEQAADED